MKSLLYNDIMMAWLTYSVFCVVCNDHSDEQSQSDHAADEHVDMDENNSPLKHNSYQTSSDLEWLYGSRMLLSKKKSFYWLLALTTFQETTSSNELVNANYVCSSASKSDHSNVSIPIPPWFIQECQLCVWEYFLSLKWVIPAPVAAKQYRESRSNPCTKVFRIMQAYHCPHDQNWNSLD